MAPAGAERNKLQLLCLCYLILVIATLISEGGVLAARPFSPSILETEKQGLARLEEGPPAATTTMAEGSGIIRRGLVGSRAPTCTYNECRGCRHRCSAHGIPVDASDPMNSAYHYRCFCHV